MSNDEVVAKLIRLDNNVKQFKQEIFQLSWYMRGGVSAYDLLHYYTFDDRQAMYEVTKGNIEITKSTQMPII